MRVVRGLSAGSGLLGLAAAALSIEPAAAHHVMDNQLPATLLQGLLSGLGHPVIGLDHLAAVIAGGGIAASQYRGAALALNFVFAMILGTVVHITEASIPAGEILVALSVVALGLVMARTPPVSRMVALGLFALAGLFHGYALGESIVGAEPAPLYAYLAGLAVVQSLIALTAMRLTQRLLARRVLEAAGVRLAGAAIAGFGFALLAQQLGA